jgi:hypothetical protein
MLKGGDYVRLFGRGYRGTVGGSRLVGVCCVEYLFCPDPRLSQPVRDCYVGECNLELCQRPSDEEAEKEAEGLRKEAEEKEAKCR